MVLLAHLVCVAPNGTDTLAKQEKSVELYDSNFTGNGTAESPFLLSNRSDLEKLSRLVTEYETDKYAKAHYRLTADIDMGGVYDEQKKEWDDAKSIKFTPIGNCTSIQFKPENDRAFSGVFDGNGHSIKKLYVSNTTGNYIGFFGIISNATIKNLIIESGLVRGNAYVGAFVGMMHGKSLITDCINKAMVNASSSFVGGITGYINGTEGGDTSAVKYSVNAGDVACSVASIVGGIAGANDGTILECYNIGGVMAKSQMGAIVGILKHENKGVVTMDKAYYNKDTLAIEGSNPSLTPSKSYGTAPTTYEDNKLSTSKMVTLYENSKPSGMNLSSGKWYFKKPASKEALLHYYPLPVGLKTNGRPIEVDVAPGIYNVTFNLNGGESSVPATQQVREGEYASQPINPTRSGYKFLHWAVDTKAGTAAFDFSRTRIEDDITLYAIWEFKDPTVEIKITLKGATSATTAKYGDTVTLTANVTHGADTVAYEWYEMSSPTAVVATTKSITLRTVADSGIYRCRITVSDSKEPQNEKSVYSEKVTVTISKAVDPSYKIPNPDAVTYYKGIKLGDIKLPSGYEWTYPSTALSATPAEGMLYSFIYTPKDTDNYLVISYDKARVIVNKASYEGIAYGKDITDIVYKDGLTLADIVLEQYFRWQEPSTKVYAGENQIFTALYNADRVNYNDFHVQIKISVAKADPTVNPSFNGHLYENSNLNVLELTLSEGDTPGECRFVQGQVLQVGKYAYYSWYFTPEDTDNYNGTRGEIELFVYAIRLEGIRVDSLPSRMVYTAFEQLDTTGLIVVKVFNNGETEEIPAGGYRISYIANPNDEEFFLVDMETGDHNMRSVKITLIESPDKTVILSGFTVNKADYKEEDVRHKDIEFVYAEMMGYTEITSRLEKNYTFVRDDINYYIPQILTAGEFICLVKYNADVKNYNYIYIEVRLNILKATYTEKKKEEIKSNVIDITVTYVADMTLEDIDIAEQFGDDAYKWTEPKLMVNAGAQQSFEAYYNHDSKNYENFVFTVKVTIKKGQYELTGVSFDDKEFLYDGKEHSIYITGELPDGVMATYSGNGVSRAGNYVVTVSFSYVDQYNYEPILPMQANLIINKRNITVDFTQNFDGDFVYSGEYTDITADIAGVLDGDNVTIKLIIMKDGVQLGEPGMNSISRILEPGYYVLIAEVYNNDDYKLERRTEVSFVVRAASVPSESIEGRDPQVVLTSVDGIDPNARLVVSNRNPENLDELNMRIKSHCGNFELYLMYDIRLMASGENVVPLSGKAQLKIKIPTELLAEIKEFEREIGIVYVDEDNSPHMLKAKVEGDYIVFDVEHLSNYAIVISVDGETLPGGDNVQTPPVLDVYNGGGPSVILFVVIFIALLAVFATITVYFMRR